MAIRDNDLNVQGTERGTVAGLFSDESKAQQAISDLRSAGFSDNQIGVARADSSDVDDIGADTSSRLREGSASVGQHREQGMWDKVKEMFGAEDRRDENITSSTDYNYADSDDFRDSLYGAGLPENQSRYFSSRMDEGCLVTVNASGGRAAEAIAILERNGADIGSGAVNFGTERESVRDVNDVGERRIQLLGEMLRVHKERVARGEVRVRKEVVTENRNIQVPVTREELVIERTDVSGEVPANAQIGEDQDIRIPLTEEQVRVEKQPVVTGEVRVGKKQVQDTRNVSDTVRREEIKVDREGDVDVDQPDITKKKRIA